MIHPLFLLSVSLPLFQNSRRPPPVFAFWLFGKTPILPCLLLADWPIPIKKLSIFFALDSLPLYEILSLLHIDVHIF
jgi:hypothetical protein